MAYFSDHMRFKVVEDDVRISLRVTDRRVDEYYLPVTDVLEVIQSPVPGPEWVETYTIKVKMDGVEGLLGVRASAWKWDIYSVTSGSLITLIAQLRSELGVD